MNLAICQDWLATHLSRNGDVAGAIRYRQIAATTYENLAAGSPNDAKVLESQVANWGELGKLQVQRGDWAAAPLRLWRLRQLQRKGLGGAFNTGQTRP